MLVEIHLLTPGDITLMRNLSAVFAEAFNDKKTYCENKPGAKYLQQLLKEDYFIALVAIVNCEVVGGITAYELKKFEQERSEIYLYDLAVLSPYRRQGIATALLEKLKALATTRGVGVIFVQADTGVEDEPAIALYARFGQREEVLHFDIQVDSGTDDK